VTVHTGLRVTTPARTLLDLADVLDPAALDNAIERALILRRFNATEVRAVLQRANGRRGAKWLREAVSGVLDAPPKTRSDLERDFLAFCHAHGLPTPATNTLIEGYEVDAHFPGTTLIVELDGRTTHTTPHAFERDRKRDRALAVAGYTVIRITDRQLTSEPESVAGDLRALLDQTSEKSRTTWVASIPSTSATISPR
jgi:hypothetical protein